MITRAAIDSDLDGILKIQSLNLYTNLSVAERVDGFVMTPFTVENIKTLMAQMGVFVVEDQGIINGYVFAGSWDFFSQWPIFPYMASRFPPLEFRGMKITTGNTFQYGPICIDRSLRGNGVFYQLFEVMRSSFADRYPLGITFINKMNVRSLAAHTRKLDLEIIDEFEFNNNSFYSLVFSTKTMN